jgi:protein TonB
MAMKAPKSTAGAKPRISTAQPQGRFLFVWAAAGAVVALIGGGYWIYVHERSVAARAKGSASLAASYVAADVAEVEERALRNSTAAAAPKTSSQPKPPAPARPARAKSEAVVAATAVRQNADSTSRPDPDAAPIRQKPDPAIPAKDPSSNARTTSRTSVTPPVGPFFETRDVNESPRVMARVEPRLPGELKARSVNEMVIVRALVSQSGHPSRVSLLRKSRTGPQLDDVVVAAVNQWTFSPARKKGEPVSCWFNFGVQVGRPE